MEALRNFLCFSHSFHKAFRQHRITALHSTIEHLCCMHALLGQARLQKHSRCTLDTSESVRFEKVGCVVDGAIMSPLLTSHTQIGFDASSIAFPFCVPLFTSPPSLSFDGSG